MEGSTHGIHAVMCITQLGLRAEKPFQNSGGSESVSIIPKLPHQVSPKPARLAPHLAGSKLSNRGLRFRDCLIPDHRRDRLRETTAYMRERVEKKRADDVASPAVEVDRTGTGWWYCLDDFFAAV